MKKLTGNEDTPWLQVATRRTVVVRALTVAAVVGTLLALINHGDYMISGYLSFSVMVKIGVTYLVPYGVSTYSSVGAIRTQESLAACVKNPAAKLEDLH